MGVRPRPSTPASRRYLGAGTITHQEAERFSTVIFGLHDFPASPVFELLDEDPAETPWSLSVSLRIGRHSCAFQRWGRHLFGVDLRKEWSQTNVWSRLRSLPVQLGSDGPFDLRGPRVTAVVFSPRFKPQSFGLSVPGRFPSLSSRIVLRYMFML